MAKGLTSNRVCTFLIDLSPTDLENPLAQFNHTFPVKESVWELVRTINISLKEDALKESVLAKVFETYWVQFESDFKKIIETTPETAVITKRKDNDIMLDVLSTVRMLDKRMRNLESTTGRQLYTIDNDSVTRDGFGSQEVRSFISSLIEQELPEQIIVELVGDKYKYPRSLIRREVQRAKKIREVNEDN
ncbi:hypothetical protein [Flavobacterium panici]|uniref:Uncharacterized protein n=1 Tax=Flavobacterium panici TaxID=2654843 RepID=A0A9N8J8V0_9FLAO|nr:hypothetical protein [Flavobacterium panici]CAC9976767.1 hypothetical protein FLAPXU55_04495 [Flavobacterium panici]